MNQFVIFLTLWTRKKDVGSTDGTKDTADRMGKAVVMVSGCLHTTTCIIVTDYMYNM